MVLFKNEASVTTETLLPVSFFRLNLLTQLLRMHRPSPLVVTKIVQGELDNPLQDGTEG